MKLKTKVVLTITLAVVGLFVGIIITNNSQSQAQQSQVKLNNNELDKEATPIVDFDDNESKNSNIEQDREFKNAQYDNSSFVLSNPPPNAGELTRWNSEIRLSDIPVEQSTIIVEGRVTASKAFLSNDKTGIYSEFTIFVSRALKNNSENFINSEETVVGERFGGRVRYPSGKVIRYKLAGQGSPSIGDKYLFFLAKTPTKNYRILTAYELRDNKVFALDGARTFPLKNSNSIFDTHNEKEYEDFIKEVNQSIKNKGGK